MKNNPLPRLDTDADIRESLLPNCRLKYGQIWEDTVSGHKIGCLDAGNSDDIRKLMGNKKASLAIHDPPYNFVAFEDRPLREFIGWCRQWIENTDKILDNDASLYVWLGADQTEDFQPLPDFMIMMRSQPFRAGSFITMRNQRGYGTQKNWMAVRQNFCIMSEAIRYSTWMPNIRISPKF